MCYVVRSVLGLMVCLSLLQFCHRICTIFGRDVAICLLLLTSTQFHFLYYASRPLPNTFALILGRSYYNKVQLISCVYPLFAVLLAYGSWLSNNTCTLIWLSALATIIFRAELSGLFGLIILQEVIRRRIAIGTIFKYAIPAGMVSLGKCAVS